MTEQRKRGRPKKVVVDASTETVTSVTTDVSEHKPRPKSRTPISRMKNLLTAEPRKGYVRRFVNDDERGLRIAMFQEAGWTLVEGNVQVGDKGVINRNNSLSSSVRTHVGGGKYAYLMEIKEEYYLEDQLAKEVELKKIDEAMRDQTNVEGRYGKLEIS